MRIKNLIPQRYKRFFAFGCSFTNYKWPTWADIISQDIPSYQNWGKPGAGNHYIFNSIIEADQRHNFNKDDLVIVMWSYKDREDRYFNKKWMNDPVSTQEKTYGTEWFKRFSSDTRGFLIRDLAFMLGAQSIIKKASWEQFCVTPLTNIDTDQIVKDGIDVKSFSNEHIRNFWISIFDNLCDGTEINQYIEEKDVIEVYKNLFLDINKTLEGRRSYEQFKARNMRTDLHPTPIEALEFIDSVWADNTLTTTAREYANTWHTTRPDFKRF